MVKTIEHINREVIEVKIIEYESKIYSLKISIGDYIAIDQLNLIDRLSTYPSTVDYLTLCSILMNKYDFNEEQLFDFMDYITDEYNINLFLRELLIDSGILGNEPDQEESTESTDEQSTFEEQLNSMLKDCLAFGLDVDTFYSMSFKEVRLFIDGIKERNQIELQNRSMMDYLLANLITTGTGIVLGSKAEFPKYEEYYGSIFGEEIQEDKVLEGYATDTLGNKTPVYKKKFDAENDLARAEMLAIAQQQQLNKIQKELNN